jgi:hypothetical protein
MTSAAQIPDKQMNKFFTNVEETTIDEYTTRDEVISE